MHRRANVAITRTSPRKKCTSIPPTRNFQVCLRKPKGSILADAVRIGLGERIAVSHQIPGNLPTFGGNLSPICQMRGASARLCPSNRARRKGRIPKLSVYWCIEVEYLLARTSAALTLHRPRGDSGEHDLGVRRSVARQSFLPPTRGRWRGVRMLSPLFGAKTADWSVGELTRCMTRFVTSTHRRFQNRPQGKLVFQSRVPRSYRLRFGRVMEAPVFHEARPCRGLQDRGTRSSHLEKRNDRDQRRLNPTAGHCSSQIAAALK